MLIYGYDMLPFFFVEVDAAVLFFPSSLALGTQKHFNRIIIKNGQMWIDASQTKGCVKKAHRKIDQESAFW